MAELFQWIIEDKVSDEIKQKFPELDPIVVQIMHNRGVETQAEVDNFLLPDYRQDQHDPYLFRDMDKVVQRIDKALQNKEKIVIHGDYDADGVCASAVLFKTLNALDANLEVYLPHRDTEGYGLNMNTVEKLAEAKTDLIITVDCGISNKPEISKAAELGMDVIVTDHHSEPVEMPDKAYAILNPKLDAETYPFKYLAGVGVAFKLCQALINKYDLGEAFEKWLLDLVAISTVTDFVPLIGENRVFLRYGLVVLQKNMRPGLQELFSVMNVDPKTTDAVTIGFKIGPHLNAAGRIDHANAAYQMLVEEDQTKAAEMARDLGKANRTRQKMSAEMSKEALEQAEKQKDEFVIVVHGDEWPVGLVGLVAGKVASTYNRPTLVITSMGGETMGSSRSIEHFNLVEALQSMDDLFSKYGGHPMACGFSLKEKSLLPEFTERIRKVATEHLADKDLRKTIKIETEISLEQANWDLIKILEQLAPFGQGNFEPIFASSSVTVEDFICVGKNKDHLKMTISQNGVKRPCIGFKCGEFAEKLKIGGQIDIAFNANVNEWNGNREIQLIIKDINVVE